MGISRINLEVDVAPVKEAILTDDYRLASSGGVITEIASHWSRFHVMYCFRL